MTLVKTINTAKISFFFPIIICSLAISTLVQAQTANDSIKSSNWNFHFQNTVIGQYHPTFHANYSGINSLDPKAEFPISVTGTLFFGAKLWKGAEVYFNPEISGGSGFSKTTGVAGFPNGEVYRVSDAAPKVYVARLFLKQVFSLDDEFENVTDDLNQIATRKPTSYFAIYAGKYSVMDYFDNNKYSHDPRTQFYNWALMGNGAWDYPANTRGYDYGLTFELVKPQWALRFSAVMVPINANGWIMDPDVKRSRSEALEFEHKYILGNQSGIIRFMTYLNEARMGNYLQAIEWGKIHKVAPDIDSVQSIGRTKYGFGINVEQSLSKNLGMFLRTGWNDGHNETWAFTEIDHHISFGFMFNGSWWNRKNDNFGIAQIVNGISKEHQDYLKSGGYGFIIGDGNLNYRPEFITELFYSFKLQHYPWWISPDFQYIIDPAYNKDRGPVLVLGIRSHVEF